MNPVAAASARPSAARRKEWSARAAELVRTRSSVLALAGFALVGMAVLDDYGIWIDEDFQRRIAQAVVDYVLGDDGALRALVPYHDRFYGVVFEAPLVLIERLLGPEDTRAVLLSRHLLTHLFFLAGGLAASLLAYRLCRSRWLALFALLVFVLHPRLYAHSFLNSKDVPFLAMFMIALYLVHRAFRQGGPGAFAACGAAVGVLTNLRIMGVLLFAAVLALRALDLVQADGQAQRRRVLRSAGVFVLAGALTLYAVSPALWSNPFELTEAFAIFSRYPHRPAMLFQGEIIRWPEIPAHYLPTWIAITTPPAVLALSLAGAAAVALDALARPGEALRNTDARFGLLLAACPVLTVLAAVVLNANVYDGWRQVYFLYAPISLLAVLGLRRLESLCVRPALRTVVRVLAVASVAATVWEMVLIHPYQMSWFNPLVDRRTPDYLRTRYDMASWGAAHREGLEYLLRRHPAAAIPLLGDDQARRNLRILPATDRHRILFIRDVPEAGGFFITGGGHSWQRGRYAPPFAPVIHTRKVHNNTVLAVTALDPALVDEATAQTYREVYRSTTRGTPVVRSDFDLHLDANALTWVKDSCRPADVRGPFYFFLRVVPVDLDDLPPGRRERGFENLSFGFPQFGVHLDGACMMRRPLPDYPIRHLETGQRIAGGRYQYDLWRAAIALSPSGDVTAAADVYREAYRAAAAREPVARSYFDLYLDGEALTWVRESCSPRDTRGRFFLHFLPEDPNALSRERRPHGFEALDFDFRRGPWQFPRVAGYFDGRCLASVPLPEYPLAGLRTGQAAQESRLWEVELTFPGGATPASDTDGAGPGPAGAGP